jgi:hypothetical protein
MKKVILFLALIAFATFNVSAQKRIKEDRNLKGERKRIVNGVKSGEITKGEAAFIRKQTKDVKKANRCAKADGVVTKKERAKIAKQDHQLDKSIAKSKHNKKSRK